MQTKVQHKSKTERLAHKEAWQQSGLSKAAYSKQHQINYVTFCSWFAKQQPNISKEVAPKFIPVEVSASDATVPDSFATLSYSSGVRVELHNYVSASFLKQLITCK
ncbi:MAG: hypothetical protein ABI723_17175 [Bacteroidia bacterium]